MPGLNDGSVLEDTLAGVLDEYPELATVGVVPLGLSRFSHEPDMRLHTTPEAGAVLDTVERWQRVYRSVLGRRLVYAADEYYLLAGRPFPAAAAYDGFPQHENGIGMVRAFEAAFGGDSAVAQGTRPVSSPAVDGAPAEGYRARRAEPARPPRSPGSPGPDAGRDPHRDRGGHAITGRYGAMVLGPLLAHPAGPTSRVLAGGEPVLRREHRGGRPADRGRSGPGAGREPGGHRYLLPDACLSEGRFLDGLTLADLPRTVEVVPTDGRSLRASSRGEPVPVGCGQADPVTADPAPTRRPVVVVAGRPNVGKSSLVNRIVGRRAAVVRRSPG